MKTNTLYRHASWVERILGFFPIQLALGLCFTTLTPAWLLWGNRILQGLSNTQLNSVLLVTSGFIAITITLKRILNFPGEQGAAYILPTIVAIAGIILSAVLLFRIPYSNSFLLLSLGLTTFWFSAGHFIVRNMRTLILALVPFGQATRLDSSKTVTFLPLKTPELPKEHIDGVVADLHAHDITADWERFLAHCTLNHIPVYHTKQINESLSGRVKINHLSENEFGALLPSPFYQLQKRLLDILIVITLSPIAVLATIVAGYFIHRESAGGVIFTQSRIGYRGKPFKLYKLRTMRTDIPGEAVTNGENDPRITPLGKLLRKYRIDELPQLWNVLKGDMSLIGPRPGPVKLQDWYEEKVPFFSYRHVVRPGISGWAQVMQGYAEDADEMRKKLEYDFYYIKHFSMWLDMLIIYKTIRTVLTGFGSR